LKGKCTTSDSISSSKSTQMFKQMIQLSTPTYATLSLSLYLARLATLRSVPAGWRFNVTSPIFFFSLYSALCTQYLALSTFFSAITR
jgi:hypothetical protein